MHSGKNELQPPSEVGLPNLRCAKCGATALRGPEHGDNTAVPDGRRILISIREIGSLTGLGRSTIYQLIRDGKLRARKVGRRTFVLPEDLERWRASLV